jgi:two-component system cell cycle response regulator DivK
VRAAGAQAYVSKPISVVKFAETVEELLPHEEVGSAIDPIAAANESDDSPGPGETGSDEL